MGVDVKKRAFVGQRGVRVEIVKYITEKNAINEDVKTTVSLGLFWARVEDLSGSETTEGKVMHIINRIYTVPFNAELQAKGEHMVVIDGVREYRIYYVQEVGRREQLKLKCTNRE